MICIKQCLLTKNISLISSNLKNLIRLNHKNKTALKFYSNKHKAEVLNSKLNENRLNTTSKPLVETETILKLLNSINNRKEVDLCLKYISNTKLNKNNLQSRLIVIKVGGALINNLDELDELCNNINFLQHLGFSPLIVHGAGPQLNKLLAQNKVEPKYIEGIRVTDAKTLEVARGVFQSENLKLVEKLENMKCRARPLNGGVFLADYLNKEKYEYVGNIYDIDISLILSSLKAGAIPVLTSLAESKDGQILNVNADVAANKVAQKLKPMKVIYLNDKGGLINERTKKLIKEINITSNDYTELMKEDWVKYGTKLKLLQIKELMDSMPETSTVSIVKAKDLAREIFSYESLGTLFKKGSEIVVRKLNELEAQEKQKISQIIDLDTEINIKLTEKCDVICDTNYQSAALIINDYTDLKNVSYVKELEVTKSNTNNKNDEIALKEQLFSKLVDKYDNLIWIAKNNNSELLAFYFDQSKGSFSINSKNKIVFWKGKELENIELVTKVINYISTNINNLSNDTALNSRIKNPKTNNIVTNQRRFCSALIKSNNKIIKRLYTTQTNNIKVGLIGARGHTGQELIKLIDNHPRMELKYISSRENENKLLKEYKKREIYYKNIKAEQIADYSKEVDVWIMALPNNVCGPFVEEIEKYNNNTSKEDRTMVLDLSADYRFNNDWYYGLNELYPIQNYVEENKVEQVLKISNPGCYATGTQLGLYPILKYFNKETQANVFGVSGYSGAGTKPSKNNDPDNIKDNIIPYKLSGHIHELEVRRHLNNNKVYFTPHVASFFRGINLTIMVSLSNISPNQIDSIANKDRVYEIYDEFYKDKKLIKVSKDTPNLKDVQNKHFVQIGGFDMDQNKERLTIVCQIDNLMKGAATQAIQNINLGFKVNNKMDDHDLFGLEGIPY